MRDSMSFAAWRSAIAAEHCTSTWGLSGPLASSASAMEKYRLDSL